MVSNASHSAQTTPRYVAELTETQAFIADIPPLVNQKDWFRSSFVFTYLRSLQEQVVYSKEIQTTDGSLEAPEISEEEIRRQITEEFEQREKQKIAQLEEEIRKAEQEKQEEVRGNEKE